MWKRPKPAILLLLLLLTIHLLYMGHESLLDSNPDYWTLFSICQCVLVHLSLHFACSSMYLWQFACVEEFSTSLMLLLVDNTTKAIFLMTVRTIACVYTWWTSGHQKTIQILARNKHSLVCHCKWLKHVCNIKPNVLLIMLKARLTCSTRFFSNCCSAITVNNLKETNYSFLSITNSGIRVL